MYHAQRKVNSKHDSRHRQWAASAVIGLAAFVAGCSPEYRCGFGSGCVTSERAVEPMNSCALLTQADVEAVYGRVQPAMQETLGELPTQPSPAGHVSICSYFDETGGELAAYLAGRQSYSADLARVAMEQDTADARIVDGLGDAARWSGDRGQLHVLKGDTWFVVRAEGTAQASDFQNSVRIAGSFLARL